MTKRTMAIAMGGLTLALGLACGGGGGGGGGSATQDACIAYWTHYNDMPCMSSVADMDVETACPATLSYVDQADYYTCLLDNAKCNGDIPDLAGQSSCSF